MSVKHISLLELHKIHLFEQENNNDRLIVIGSKGIQLHLASSMHPCTDSWYQELQICLRALRDHLIESQATTKKNEQT